MKLVDILARELTAWPETTRLAQDSNGHVFGWTGFPNWDGDQWIIDVGASLDKCRPGEMDLADDHMTSSVPRAEWQAAVDALNAPKVVEWGGVGLPPIGMASCEYLGAHKYDEWTVVNIFAHYGHTVFVDFGDGWRAEKDSSRFRPIKTAEQVAAEEREKDIREMASIPKPCGHALYNICADLYDAGYRKQVAK